MLSLRACAGTAVLTVLVSGSLAAAGAAAPAYADTADTGAPGAPGAPANLLVEPGNSTLAVSWTAPESTGEGAVVEYDVTVAPSGPAAAAPAPVVVAPSHPSVDLGSLTNGTSYEVRVVARNDAGPGEAAVTTATPRTVPSAPRSVTARGEDGAAGVTWSVPASDGGDPVSAYVVTAHPSGRSTSVPAADGTVTLTGLANGVPQTFDVAAVNGAGEGAASHPSAAVTPRLPGPLVMVRAPQRQVVFGATSRVIGAVRDRAGHAVAGQAVALRTRLRPGAGWRTVAAARTDERGLVSLHARLPRTADLQLWRPAGVMPAAARAVPHVAVAYRVTAVRPARRVRVTAPVTVRGRVAPGARSGTGVRLERFASGGWRTVARGTVAKRSAYRITWRPTAAGSYRLRVVRPGSNGLVAGTSPAWQQQVEQESVADVARDILRLSRIDLATGHMSGVRDAASARDNIVAVAQGRLAARSCYQNAPCGSTSLDIRMLRAMRALGESARIVVSEVAGGSHAPDSKHYSGRAFDVTAVNGVSIAGGGNYGLVASVCRSYGASAVYDPAADPDGQHWNHVHCEWS